MLSQLFAWWLRQLAGLVPPRLRRDNGAHDAVILRIDRLGDALDQSEGAILVRRRGREAYAGPLRLGAGAGRDPGPSLAKVLRLPDGMMLRREVLLPLAAERDIAQVLGYEMDRLTPFTQDEIYWGFSGLRREPPRWLKLDLMMALRAPLEQLLAGLAALRMQPAYLEGEAGRIVLSPVKARPGRALNAVLYALCAVLLGACVAVPVIRQQWALDAAQARLAALGPAAHEAVSLRHRLSIAASGQEAIAAAEQHGDTLQILAALTGALPDDTYLTDFALKSGELTIDGESGDAARLIAVLSAAPGFLDPRFVAPVTRAADGQADLFSIHATVSP